ncbi:unnamed protein product, partial [Symbiodinium sp. CCMP2592]
DGRVLAIGLEDLPEGAAQPIADEPSGSTDQASSGPLCSNVGPTPDAFEMHVGFLVLTPRFAPETYEISLDIPCTVQKACDLLQAMRQSRLALGYEHLVAVRPQPTASFCTFLALPLWASARVCIVLDARGIDGDVVFVLRGDGTFPVAATLPEMLRRTTGWTLPVPDFAGALVNPAYLLTDAWNTIVDMPSAAANSLQAAHCFIAAFLQSEVHRLHLQPARPPIPNYSFQGISCHKVLLITERINTIPVPPGRLVPTAVPYILDLRGLLRDFVWRISDSGRIDLRILMGEYEPAPSGFFISIEGGQPIQEGEHTFLHVEAGQVLVIQYLEDHLGEPEDGPPSGHPPRPDTSDETDSSNSDTSNAPPDPPTPPPTIGSRNRKRRLGSDPHARSISGHGLCTFFAIGGIASSLPHCTEGHVHRPLGDRGPQDLFLSWFEMLFVAYCAAHLCRRVLVTTFSKPQASAPLPRTAKFLSEPVATTEGQRQCLAALRYLAPRLGHPWRYVPAWDALYIRGDSDSEAWSEVEDDLQEVIFVVLTPGYTNEEVHTLIQFPATLTEIVESVQQQRVVTRRHWSTLLTPADPQPCLGTGVLISLAPWQRHDCIICVNCAHFDGRLYAAPAPPYATRDRLLSIANISHNLGIDVFVGDDRQPLPEDAVIHLWSGLTVTFAPPGVVLPLPRFLTQSLGSRHAWSAISTVPSPPEDLVYCLVHRGECILHHPDARHPTQYRAHIAAAVGVRTAEIRLFPARPAARDATLDGLPCRAVLAVCEANHFVPEPWTGVLLDLRALAAGWHTAYAFNNRLSCTTLKEDLLEEVPIGWKLCLWQQDDNVDIIEVYSGQVIVAYLVPTDTHGDPAPALIMHAVPLEDDAAPTGSVDAPASSGGPPAPQPASAAGPVTTGSTATGQPSSPAPASEISNADPPRTEQATTYFEGCFVILGQDYAPELVRARLPVGIEPAEALTAINAARDPFPRLCLPIVHTAHPQPLAGVAVLLALPIWVPDGAVVIFDLSQVNGAMYAIQLPRVVRREGLLQAAGLTGDPPIEIFLRDLPWPLPPRADYDLLHGDVVIFLPVTQGVDRPLTTGPPRHEDDRDTDGLTVEPTLLEQALLDSNYYPFFLAATLLETLIEHASDQQPIEVQPFRHSRATPAVGCTGQGAQVLRLSDHLPSGRAFDLTEVQMLLDCSLDDVAPLLHVGHWTLATLPVLDVSSDVLHWLEGWDTRCEALSYSDIQQVDIYTDGSYDGRHSAWAFHVCVYTCGHRFHLGWQGGRLTTDPSHPGYLGEYAEGAFSAEIVALFWATCWCLQLPACAAVDVYSDCTSAISIVSGTGGAFDDTSLSGKCRAAAQLLRSTCDRHFQIHHSRSHVGNPGNEVADCLAKQACAGFGVTADDVLSNLSCLARRKSFPWLWLVAEVNPRLDWGQSRTDHIALQLWAQGSFTVGPTTRSKHFRLDTAAMRTPEGRATLSQICEGVPLQPWAMDVHRHAQALDQYFRHSLASAFPVHRTPCRHEYFSASTWQLRGKREWLRKRVKAASRMLYQWRLRSATRAWRDGRCIFDSLLAGWSSVLWALKDLPSFLAELRQSSQQLRVAIRQDHHQHICTVAKASEESSTQSIVNRLRTLTGGPKRKQRERTPLPAVERQDGTLAATDEEARQCWLDHFASIEAGSQSSPCEIVRECLHRQAGKSLDDYTVTHLDAPTLGDLEWALRSTATDRAYGLDGLPGELLHYCAPLLARPVFQLQLKSLLTLAEPVQHKGGVLHCVYKRKGPLTEDALARACQAVSLPPGVYHDIQRHLQKPALSLSAGASQWTTQALEETLHGTWFKFPSDAAIVSTAIGSRPGDSLSDLVFSLLFAQVLRHVRASLQDCGLIPEIPWHVDMLGRLTPLNRAPTDTIAVLDATWMDDLSLLLQAPDSQTLVQRLRLGASTLLDTCLEHALLPNLKRGKTEALVHLRAKGARHVKRQLFDEFAGTLPLNCRLWPEAKLRLTATYKHLGGVLHHRGSLLREVKARIAQAWTAFNSRKKQIFGSPRVDRREKALLFDSLVATTMFYGSGTWPEPSEECVQKLTEHGLPNASADVLLHRGLAPRLRYLLSCITLHVPELWALAQSVSESVQWLWDNTAPEHRHSTWEQAWDSWRQEDYRAWSVHAFSTHGRTDEMRAHDDGVDLTPVLQASGPLPCPLQVVVEEEAARPSAEILDCLALLDHDGLVPSLTEDEVWDRLRAAFSCVCLQASRLRITATVWQQLLDHPAQRTAMQTLAILREAARKLCSVDLVTWLVPAPSADRPNTDTYKHSGLYLDLLDFTRLRWAPPAQVSTETIWVRVGPLPADFSMPVPAARCLCYEHHDTLQELRDGQVVDFLAYPDPTCFYCLSVLGLPLTEPDNSNRAAPSLTSQLPGFELACELIRTAVSHWICGIPSRLVVPSPLPMSAFPLQRFPGLVRCESPGFLMVGNWRRRRSRTVVRTVLRNYTSGIATPQRAVYTAIQTLEHHHSASQLPVLAKERMKQAQSWWCYSCRKNVKASATFCPGCGQKWTTAAYAQPERPGPGRQDWGDGWQVPASPRKRREERRKLDALPRAPQATAVSLPGSSSEVERAPALSDLVAALSAVKEDLPTSVQSVLQQHLEEDVRLTSKGLHRLVTQQTQAKKELQAVRHAREVFLTEWTTYLGTLTDLLEKQTKAKAVVNVEEEEFEDMEDIVNSDAAREAAKSVAAQKALQGEDQLVQALRTAKSAADQELTGLRERTPRRKGRGPESEQQMGDKDGPVPSRKGPTGRCPPLFHSVRGAEDYVPPMMAEVYARCLQSEVRLDECDYNFETEVFAQPDPRLAWEQDDMLCWETLAAPNDECCLQHYERGSPGIEEVVSTFRRLGVGLRHPMDDDVVETPRSQAALSLATNLAQSIGQSSCKPTSCLHVQAHLLHMTVQFPVTVSGILRNSWARAVNQCRHAPASRSTFTTTHTMEVPCSRPCCTDGGSLSTRGADLTAASGPCSCKVGSCRALAANICPSLPPTAGTEVDYTSLPCAHNMPRTRILDDWQSCQLHTLSQHVRGVPSTACDLVHFPSFPSALRSTSPIHLHFGTPKPDAGVEIFLWPHKPAPANAVLPQAENLLSKPPGLQIPAGQPTRKAPLPPPLISDLRAMLTAQLPITPQWLTGPLLNWSPFEIRGLFARADNTEDQRLFTILESPRPRIPPRLVVLTARNAAQARGELTFFNECGQIPTGVDQGPDGPEWLALRPTSTDGPRIEAEYEGGPAIVFRVPRPPPLLQAAETTSTTTHTFVQGQARSSGEAMPIGTRAEPPALLLSAMPTSPSKGWGHGPQDATLLPEYLDSAHYHNQDVCMFSWGSDVAENRERFTVFDTQRHVVLVGKRRTSTLKDLVEVALATAPFRVRAIQILIDTIPGLPRPQFILFQAEVRLDHAPVPWDLREVGGNIRTVLHMQGEFVTTAIDRLQRVLPPASPICDALRMGSMVVIDTLGMLGHRLPGDLEE